MTNAELFHKVEDFLHEHEALLNRHVFTLDNLENGAHAHRLQHPHDRQLLERGALTRQAQYLRNLHDLFVDAVNDEGFPAVTVDERYWPGWSKPNANLKKSASPPVKASRALAVPGPR